MRSAGRWRWLLVSAAVLTADQITKGWIDKRPELGLDPLVVVPGFFEIVSWRNPGALFSLLTDAPDPWRTIVLTVLPMAAILAIGILMMRASDSDRFALAGYSLVLGGALGNLLDRILRGSVVDFLRFGIGYDPFRGWLEGIFSTHWWPAFNVADSAICTGAAAIALQIFRPGTGQGVPAKASPLDPPTPRTS